MQRNTVRLFLRLSFSIVMVATAFGTGEPLALATTYKVGPGQPFREISEVASQLVPGDVVEVEGDAFYEGDVVLHEAGTSEAPITLRGVRRNGARPVIAGGDWGLVLWGDHVVIEGFEITGASEGCVINNADDVMIRDGVIHDCEQGVVGGDGQAGSLSLEYVEVYRCGSGEYRHQLYIATDEAKHPGAMFRMEHCFVHDASGGNNVKSRAERTAIHHNWIEGAMFNELDLIGPDYGDPQMAREDADVVGNVIVNRSPFSIARVGGDGSGESWGRYRFVNNTMVLSPGAQAAVYAMYGIESVEMHNNAILSPVFGASAVLDGDEAVWASGKAVVTGSNNWVQLGLVGVPAGWVGTLRGVSAALSDISVLDVRPMDASPLVDAGNASPMAAAGFKVDFGLATASYLPPPRAPLEMGKAVVRTQEGALDIGAFELGTPGSEGAWEPRLANPSCSCGVAGDARAEGFWLAAFAGLLAAARRARRRSDSCERH